MQQDILQALLRHDRMVPRYTSFPTVPHFSALVPEGWFAARLAAIPADSAVSVYIHIPFCPRLCWFCGCNTKITSKYEAVSSYNEILRAEIADVAAVLADKGLRVGYIHFGGGSPTMLSEEDFADLVGDIYRYFSVERNVEIAVEIDPRHMSVQKATIYAACGVNRVSFGVQDFDLHVMGAVNRPQSFDQNRVAIAQCRAAGIDAVNIDLMYGLPHQNTKTMTDCAQKALILEPDRIALFGYAHVPWMKKHMRMIADDALPAREVRPVLFECASDIFEDAGYVTVGIDHFAKESDPMVAALRQGRLRRSFQGYTDDAAAYLLGFGASAISHLDGAYKQNHTFLTDYRDHVEKHKSPVEKYCVLTEEDKLRAAIIEGMMINLSVNPRHVALRRFGQARNFDPSYVRLMPLVRDGLVRIGPDGTIHALVRPAARLVAAIFDDRLASQENAGARHVTAL